MGKWKNYNRGVRLESKCTTKLALIPLDILSLSDTLRYTHSVTSTLIPSLTHPHSQIHSLSDSLTLRYTPSLTSTLPLSHYFTLRYTHSLTLTLNNYDLRSARCLVVTITVPHPPTSLKSLSICLLVSFSLSL